MKPIIKRAIGDQKGAALALALVLLVVGGLILTPLLGLMTTGLVSGQIYERKTDEYYAADAGVEDAIWQLKQPEPDPDRVPLDVGQSRTYSLDSHVNDKGIEVTVYMVAGTSGSGIYNITSTATSSEGFDTTIESFVQTVPLFWKYAIVSTSDIALQPDSKVYGSVMGNLTGPGGDPAGNVTGNIDEPYDQSKWPSSEDLRAFYWPHVENTTLPYGECCAHTCTLDISVNSTSGVYHLGPGFHDGTLEDLYIESSSSKNVITAELTGPVYIKGEYAGLYIGAGTGSKEFYLDLNYQTIYVEGSSHNLSQPNEKALYVDKSVHLKGSGVIIVEGNVDFHPTMDLADDDDFIFVLSVFGGVKFFPNGTIYGSVAAQDVYLASNTVLTRTDPPTNPETGETVLSFPTQAVEWDVKILTWEIR